VDECVRGLVLLKMYKNRRRNFFVRTIRNRKVKMNKIPILSYPLLKIVSILFV